MTTRTERACVVSNCSVTRLYVNLRGFGSLCRAHWEAVAAGLNVWTHLGSQVVLPDVTWVDLGLDEQSDIVDTR